MTQALTRARGERLAGTLDSAIHAVLEERITRVLGIVVRGSLALDRE